MFRNLSIKDLYIQIIVANIAIFLLANIMRSVGSPFIVNWFAVPLGGGALMKFWTLITANFLHEGFRHLFGNMIILMLFGWLAQHFFKRQSVLSLYVVGGITGIALILLVGRLTPFNGYALGASCSVFAVMVATAIYNPNFQLNLFLIGRVKLKWVALVFVLFGIVIDFSGNIVGTIGHLGGALFGAWYGYSYRRKGHNILGWLDKWFASIGLGKESRCAAEKTTYRKPRQKVSVQSNSSMNMDRILDKISKSGMNSLSKEEKEFLEKS